MIRGEVIISTEQAKANSNGETNIIDDKKSHQAVSTANENRKNPEERSEVGLNNPESIKGRNPKSIKDILRSKPRTIYCGKQTTLNFRFSERNRVLMARRFREIKARKAREQQEAEDAYEEDDNSDF